MMTALLVCCMCPYSAVQQFTSTVLLAEASSVSEGLQKECVCSSLCKDIKVFSHCPKRTRSGDHTTMLTTDRALHLIPMMPKGQRCHGGMTETECMALCQLQVWKRNLTPRTLGNEP